MRFVPCTPVTALEAVREAFQPLQRRLDELITRGLRNNIGYNDVAVFFEFKEPLWFRHGAFGRRFRHAQLRAKISKYLTHISSDVAWYISCKVMSAYLRHFYGFTTACVLKGRKPAPAERVNAIFQTGRGA